MLLDNISLIVLMKLSCHSHFWSFPNEMSKNKVSFWSLLNEILRKLPELNHDHKFEV